MKQWPHEMFGVEKILFSIVRVFLGNFFDLPVGFVAEEFVPYFFVIKRLTKCIKFSHYTMKIVPNCVKSSHPLKFGSGRDCEN